MNSKRFVISLTILFAVPLLIWIEFGRSTTNAVVPLGVFKLVAEIEDFSLDLQVSSPDDPLSPGWHGYSNASWSSTSPFGRFELIRLWGTPDGRIPFYSQVVVPAWLPLLIPIALLIVALGFKWSRSENRPEHGVDHKPDHVPS